MASGSTDTRIVQMQFDNRDFEKNIAQSEKSLDKFKEALDFAECEKSLEDFGDATRKLTFDQMAANLQKLTDKFTGLGTVGEYALSQIRHGLESAAAKAKGFFDSMTIEQVNAGFEKFGQLNKNVQTIMAATGRSEEDVYAVMKRLNDYTDQTSYSFTDMASNIGKFTSIGVPLEQAEKQMEGIANWAARSGGGIQEASRAMYNLSQAMGVGALTKIDWKSIENAGMATKEFKEQLIQAGIATGQLVKQNGKVMTAKSLGKQIEVTYQNLAETLSKKWADTEVMQKSFMAYYYEDLYYTGEIERGVQTSKEQRDEIKNLLKNSTERDYQDMAKFSDEAGKETKKAINLTLKEQREQGKLNDTYYTGVKNAKEAQKSLKEGYIDSKAWVKLGIDSEETRKKILDAAVEQKKLIKEINDEGYTVYKTPKGKGKQTEIDIRNFEKEFLDKGMLDESLSTVVFGLDIEPMIETTKKQQQALNDALKDDVILKKDWVEGLTEAGLATKEFKQAAMDAAVAAKTLKKEKDKATGKDVYKTMKGTIVTIENFDNSLKDKWFTGEVGNRVAGMNNLAKAAYEAAQKCMTFTDVLNAWKDQLSTGWMQSYNKIFGELSESMELFTNICNKVAEALDRLLQFRNRVLEAWGNGGGRENLWSLIVGEVLDGDEAVAYKGVYGILDIFGDLGQMLADGFWEMMKIFASPGEAGNWDEVGFREGWMAAKLNLIITSVRDFIQKIHEFFNASAEGSEKSRWQQIQDVVNAIYATFVLAYTVVRDVVGFLGKLFDQDHLGKSMDSILKLLSALGIGVYNMADSAEEGEGLQKLFDGLLASLEPLIAAVNELVGVITDNLIEMIQNGEEGGTFADIWQTICDIFSLLGKVVSKVAPPVLHFISDILGIINDLFDGELTGEKLKALGARLETSITNLFDGIFGLIPGFGKDLQGFIAYIFGFAEEGAEDGTDESSKTILGVAKQWLRKIFGGFADLFDNIKGDAEQFNLFTWAKDMLGIGSFGKFIGQMAGVVKGTNLYGIIMSFLGGYALFKLIGTLRQGTGLLRNLTGFFQGAKDVMKDGLKLKFGDQLESTGDKVQKIATGIALIAGSVAILGSMSVDSLVKGFAALVGVMLALTGFMLIMKKFVLKDWKDAIGMTGVIAAVAAAILSITIGIGLLMLMLKPLATMSIEGIVKMLTGLLGVVTILGLMAKYIGKDMKNLKGAGSIAAMAIAIGILIFALRPLANMEWEGMLKMGIGLIAIMYILTEFSNKVGSLKIKGGGSIAILAAAIGILVFALMGLKDLNAEQLIKMGASLVVILGVLALFTKTVSSMKGSGMGSMIMLAGSIWILMEALMPLAKLKWEELGKLGAGLGAIMLVIGIFINSTQSMKGTGMGNILMIAASMWLLVKAIEPLANYEWHQLAKMGVGLAVLSGIVLAMTHLAGDMNILQGAGIAIMLVGFAGVLLAFGFAMSALAGLTWTQITAACYGLVAVIAAFGLIQKVLLKDNDIFDALNTLLLLAGLAAVMIAFSIALNEIKNVPTEKIVAFSVGLGVLVAAVAVALNLTRGMSIVGALKGILILSAAVAALMVVFAIVGNFAMNSIGSGLSTLAAHLKLFSGMISDFSERMNSVNEQSIEKAKRIVDMLVKLLGDIGGIVIGAESARALTAMSSNLTLTSGMLIDFGTRMSSVSLASFVKAQTIIGMMTGMMQSLEGFGDYTAQREAFTTALFDIGTSVESFATHSGNVGDQTNNSALQLIKDLAGCANDLDTIAKMNLDSLTAKMTGLGGAMMLYAKGAEEATGLNVNAEGAPDVAGAVKLMRDISDSMTKDGGFSIPENMPSDEALGTFGAQLAALAGALVMFEEAGSSLGEGTDKALACLDFFVALKGKLATMNLGESLGTILTAFVTGENVTIQPNELETFGKNIEQLGLALKAFAQSTTIMDESTGEIVPVDYSVAISALESFSGLANSLPTIGGIRSWWEGNKQSLKDLAADLEALGQGLKDFSMKVSGKSEDEYAGITDAEIEEGKTATTTIIDKAVEVFTKITEAQSSLQNVGGLESIWSGDPPKISDIAAQLEVLGQGLKDFSLAVTGKSEDEYKGITDSEIEDGKTATTTIVDKAIDVFAKIVEVQGQLKDKGGIESIWSGDPPKLDDLGSQIGGLGEGLQKFSDAVSGANNPNGTPFNPEAATSALGLIDSMISVMTQIGTKLPKIGGVGQFFNTLVEGRQSDLTDIGTQIGGLGDGLNGFATAVTGKFENADEIINALNVVSKVIDMIATLATTGNMISYSNIAGYVDYVSEFLNGMMSITNDYNGHDRGQTVVDSLVSMMSAISTTMAKAGDIDNENMDIFATFIGALNNLANINMENTVTMFETIGKNIDIGIVNGINDAASIQAVVDAATAVALAAYNSACEALGIESPSRLFMGIGGYMAKGMAIGISDSAGLAAEASEDMANSTVDSACGLLANLSSLLTDDIDANPTIRPVLDLSNVTAGAQTLNGMFGRSYGLGLNTGGVSSRASRTFSPVRAADAANQNGSDAESMMSRMDAMLENIQKMGDGMANMKLVLDTGVVAGGVSDDVDIDIGRKMFYAGRRN